jgi:hypothetical protein
VKKKQMRPRENKLKMIEKSMKSSLARLAKTRSRHKPVSLKKRSLFSQVGLKTISKLKQLYNVCNQVSEEIP